jgi:hypothetical protein
VGGVVGVVLAANVLGFPEVEIGEAGAVAMGPTGVSSLAAMDAMAGEPVGSLFVGGISMSGAGGFVGFVTGLAEGAPPPYIQAFSYTSADSTPYSYTPTNDAPLGTQYWPAPIGVFGSCE